MLDKYLIKDYLIESKIENQFSILYIVKSLDDNKKYIIKYINSNRKNKFYIRDIYYKIIKNDKYFSNIANIYDIKLINELDYYILMEYVNGKNLNKFFKNEVENDKKLRILKTIFYQVAEGIDSLNQNGFFHTDIIGHNIIIENHSKKVKIIDFDFCVYSEANLNIDRLSYLLMLEQLLVDQIYNYADKLEKIEILNKKKLLKNINTICINDFNSCLKIFDFIFKDIIK